MSSHAVTLHRAREEGDKCCYANSYTRLPVTDKSLHGVCELPYSRMLVLFAPITCYDLYNRLCTH